MRLFSCKYMICFEYISPNLLHCIPSFFSHVTTIVTLVSLLLLTTYVILCIYKIPTNEGKYMIFDSLRLT